MHFLPLLAVRRPIACCMLAITLMVCGLLSWRNLELGMFPDLRQPALMVVINAGQRSALEMEQLYGEVTERQLFSIRGLKSIEQTATTGRLLARLSFDWSTDLDLALVDVNRALATLSASPDIDSLVVRHFDPQQKPVMVLGVTTSAQTGSFIELRQLAQRRLSRQLEQQDGVAEVRVAGGRLPEIAIRLDPIKLNAYQLTIAEVVQRIRAANAEVHAGSIEQGEKVLLVKAKSRFTRLDDISAVVVRYQQERDKAEQVAVTVADIATVEMAEQQVRGLVRVNGQEGVGLFVYKDGGANSVAVARAVRQALIQLQHDFPQLQFVVVADDAEVIEASVADVESATVYGIVLATLVLVVFLRSPAPVVIVALSIPVSLLTTIIVMNISGQSLNLMTLGGLALGAGILIDNSIVVIDSIYRYRRQGYAVQDAAARGAGAMTGAIFSSTLTSCAIFLPVLFIDGIAARLLSGLALTVVVTLLASLLVAIVLIPALARLMLPDTLPRDVDPGNQVFELWVWRLLGHARRVLGFATVLTLLAVCSLYLLGTELVPPQDPRQLTLRLTTTSGQSALSTASTVAVVEQLIKTSSASQIPAILSEVGRSDEQQGDIIAIQREENQAQIQLRLAPDSGEGTQLIRQVNAGLAGLHGVEAEWQAGGSILADALGQQDRGLRVEITGGSYAAIREVSTLVKQRLQQESALYQVSSSFDGAAPLLTVRLNPAAAAYGVDATRLAQVLTVALDGQAITSMMQGDEERQIVVSLSSQQEVQQLSGIRFRNAAGQYLTLADVATVVTEPGVHTIYRRDQRRLAEVYAQPKGLQDPAQLRAQVQQILAQLPVPAGSSVRLLGHEQQQQLFSDFLWVVLLAIGLVFMVLAATFESLLLPMIILSAIPLGLIGVAVLLVPFGNPLGAMAMLGIVVLTGVVVNDAILLVQKAHALMSSGMPPRQALAHAAARRLRPILMTSITTMVALLPLALGSGDAAAIRAPLALTLIGGLLTATIGSLTVTPCLYLLLIQRRHPAEELQVTQSAECYLEQKVS